jgi:hypothetical protein
MRSCCPPEYAYFEYGPPAKNEAELPAVTTKADIFHLGIALWYLAMGYPTPETCRGPPGKTQQATRPYKFQPGDSAIALAPLPDSIPRYYRDMVAKCSSLDPNDRPSAWRVLELFPPSSNFESPGSEISRFEPLELSLRSMKKAFQIRIYCSYCSQFIQDSCFHCNICDEMDFDMCLSCYSQGRHCYDGSHLLVQLFEKEFWGVSKRYHSIAENSEPREIIEL